MYRSGGATVTVHATVTDSSHRLVTNLDVDAFIVSDDHGVRPITVFERKELPVSVVMLLDASESMRDSTTFLRDAAKQFVANLRPGDRMEIGAFHNTIRWVRPFTSNQDFKHCLMVAQAIAEDIMVFESCSAHHSTVGSSS